ncbi:MAG: FAD-dependent oxidoreductase [Solirubrobacterales bacterium]
MSERHDAHGYWLAEADPAEPAPALEGQRSADVVVVGGGYTGLWTAWQVKRLQPEASVVVLEQEGCGVGPSGRNGGFLNGLWFSLPTLRKHFGDREAIAVARAAQRSVTEIGDFCRDQRVDAWYRQAGYLQVSTAPAWDRAWEPAMAACRELGEPDACVALDPEQVRLRCDSPIFRGAGFYKGAATVQPARLALGLARRVRERGVAVYEHSEVTSVERRGGDVVAETKHGSVRAKAAVMAGGGALARLPGMQHRLTLTSSHIVITEPVPDVLERIGWTGGECITDSRAMVHYFRTTPDGRIAFGWGGGRVAFGTRTDGRAEHDPAVIDEVRGHLRRFFPGLEGRRIEHAWGGPIDVSPSHLPVIAELEQGIHCAFGYTGHGVGPSHMLGRSLASLALERRDEASRLAFVDPPAQRVPPEPFRYVGGSMIRRAILRTEAALERGRTPGPVTRALAGIPERLGIHIGR